MFEVKIGSTVRLKSGGPIMTVSGFCTTTAGKIRKDNVECVWYDPDTRAARQTFMVDELFGITFHDIIKK